MRGGKCGVVNRFQGALGDSADTLMSHDWTRMVVTPFLEIIKGPSLQPPTDRRPHGRSGPVQNQSGPGGP